MSNKRCYVVNRKTGLVQHEGTELSCHMYCQNSSALFGAGPFTIAYGAADLVVVQRHIRDANS